MKCHNITNPPTCRQGFVRKTQLLPPEMSLFFSENFCEFWNSYFGVFLQSHNHLITHSLGSPPKGTGYEKFDCRMLGGIRMSYA